MSSSRQFVIMSLHEDQKSYHKVFTNCLSHSAISSIDSGKGSMFITAAWVWKVRVRRGGEHFLKVT